MRIDKYLKVARVLKRRVVAKELAENDRLLINGRQAKASSEIKPLDEITIIFGHRELVIRVLEVKEHAKKEETAAMYEVISEKRNVQENEL